jgi:hypothetical protein
MPSPKVSLRLEPEKYAVLVKLSRAENKNMTDLVRALIDEALDKRQVNKAAKDLEQLQKEMEESFYQARKLLIAIFEQSGKAHFYGRLGKQLDKEANTFALGEYKRQFERKKTND